MNNKRSILLVVLASVSIFAILAIQKTVILRRHYFLNGLRGIIGKQRENYDKGGTILLLTDHSINETAQPKEGVISEATNFGSLSEHTDSQPTRSATEPNRLKLTNEAIDFGKLEMAEDNPNNIRNQKIVNQTDIPELLKRLRPQIMKAVPLTFLPEYKNPCYMNQQVTCCLPYLLLLGMPKCGTTDLYMKIIQHPDITSKVKEIQWLARKSKTGKPLRDYAVRYFSRMIRELVGASLRRKEQAMTVDASASTFWDNKGWLDIYPEYINKGPPYILADVVKAILPDAKLIVTFREPASRLYSDYIFFKGKKDISQEDFHVGVTSSINSYKQCLISRGSDYACAYEDRKLRLHVGLYSIFTREWLRRYPRDQFMFINLHDWHSKCEQILPKIFEFLDAEPLSENMIAKICHREPSFDNSERKSEIGPMWNKTKTMLRDFYRPYVIDLANVLQDDGFLWDYKR